MIKALKIIQSLFLTGFGALSVFLTLSIIFDWFGIREKEGNYVLFVVYTNLICGLIYLIAVVGLIQLKRWSTNLLGVATAILVMAFLGLMIHINNGGLHETKTIGAMIFRTLLTLIFTIASYYLIKKSNTVKQ